MVLLLLGEKKKVIFTEFVRWATEGIVSHEQMFNPVTDCKAKKGLDVMQTKFEPIWPLAKYTVCWIFSPTFFPMKIIGFTGKCKDVS